MGRKVPQGIRPGRERPAHPERERRLEKPPEDTTDWNDKGNVEIWRAAWAAYTNRALEAAGQPALVDHRSYKRRGIDKIPSVHLGPAASQMEKRGIRTDKGEVNRQIAADNKLLKEIKARITRPLQLVEGRGREAGGPAAQHD